MAKLSIVTMTWNRGGQRITNLLASLLWHQNRPADEVVIVDTSDDDDIALDVARRARAFPDARLIRRPRDGIYKSWALNVGIQATSPYSRWVAATDVDFMFGPRLIETVHWTLDRKAALLIVQPLRLPQSADVSDPFEGDNWLALCMQGTWWGPTGGPGALQVLQRGKWFEIHGYGEQFGGGLGGPDTDLMDRCIRAGAQVICLPFDVAQALHQWHERSPHKGALVHLLDADAPLIANPGGWGDL